MRGRDGAGILCLCPFDYNKFAFGILDGSSASKSDLFAQIWVFSPVLQMEFQEKWVWSSARLPCSPIRMGDTNVGPWGHASDFMSPCDSCGSCLVANKWCGVSSASSDLKRAFKPGLDCCFERFALWFMLMFSSFRNFLAGALMCHLSPDPCGTGRSEKPNSMGEKAN